jgi:hypothetical protein
MLAFSTSSQCLSPRTLTLMTPGQVLIPCGLALTIHLHSWVPHMLTLRTQEGVLIPRTLTLMTRGQVLITCGLTLTTHLYAGTPRMLTLMTQERVLIPRALTLMTRLRKRTPRRLIGRTRHLEGTNRGEDSSECELSDNCGRISILIDIPYLGKLVRKITLT